jgi:uncharacterized membrane-anchored protein
MRKWILLASLPAVLAVLNGMVHQKERTLKSGTTVLLKLAPVDPRSLMQGDYMALNYGITREAEPIIKGGPPAGKLVLGLDRDGVARFVRYYNGEPLASDEQLLCYKRRRQIRLGAESFFFQEGHAQYYANAKYGELKVAPSGESVLVGLRDEGLRPLGPKAPTRPPEPYDDEKALQKVE